MVGQLPIATSGKGFVLLIGPNSHLGPFLTLTVMVPASLKIAVQESADGSSICISRATQKREPGDVVPFTRNYYAGGGSNKDGQDH